MGGRRGGRDLPREKNSLVPSENVVHIVDWSSLPYRNADTARRREGSR